MGGLNHEAKGVESDMDILKLHIRLMLDRMDYRTLRIVYSFVAALLKK